MKALPLMTVSGIRGVVGETLTEEFCASIAYAQTKIYGPGKIIVGRDTRPSGAGLAKAIFRGIRAAGGTPVDIGIAATPTTGLAVVLSQAKSGIIITASHNPGQFNGYKMVYSSGRAFCDSESTEVYNAFHAGNIPSWKEMLAFSDEPEQRLDFVEQHIDRICNIVDVDLIRKSNITVAVDSTNGAGGAIFPKLLERLGVKWIGVYNNLDGNFVHNPEPRPQHLTDLAALMKKNPGLWAGFAFDPDADRLAPMGENGESISEEMTLALALDTLLTRDKSPVATNLSTSMVIDDVAKKHGITVYRTKIGEANVVEGMVKYKCSMGGEGNGGIIYPKVITFRDGLTAIALIIELMAKKKKKITELVAEWPLYYVEKEKVSLSDGLKPAEVIAKLETIFKKEKIDMQDGLKIIWPESWVHIRASNTEPILRVNSEAKTEKEAKELVLMIMKCIQ